MRKTRRDKIRAAKRAPTWTPPTPDYRGKVVHILVDPLARGVPVCGRRGGVNVDSTHGDPTLLGDVVIRSGGKLCARCEGTAYARWFELEYRGAVALPCDWGMAHPQSKAPKVGVPKGSTKPLPHGTKPAPFRDTLPAWSPPTPKVPGAEGWEEEQETPEEWAARKAAHAERQAASAERISALVGAYQTTPTHHVPTPTRTHESRFIGVWEVTTTPEWMLDRIPSPPPSTEKK